MSDEIGKSIMVDALRAALEGDDPKMRENVCILTNHQLLRYFQALGQLEIAIVSERDARLPRKEIG